MNAAADDLLARSTPLATQVFQALLERFPNAVITADGDSIGLGTGSGHKSLVFTVLPYRKHVNIGFYRGVELADPNGLLKGTGRRHRHITIRSDAELADPALHELFATALARAGVR